LSDKYTFLEKTKRYFLFSLGFLISILFILSVILFFVFLIYSNISNSEIIYFYFTVIWITGFVLFALIIFISSFLDGNNPIADGVEIPLAIVVDFATWLQFLFVTTPDKKYEPKIEEVKSKVEPKMMDKSIVEIKPKSLRDLFRLNKPIKKIICPHCLKSILINDLDAICPFCDSIYSSKTENILGVLLDKCPKCDGKIKLYQCVYCREHIDLFAPHDEEELEKRRYE
jgi:hypothetical protein